MTTMKHAVFRMPYVFLTRNSPDPQNDPSYRRIPCTCHNPFASGNRPGRVPIKLPRWEVYKIWKPTTYACSRRSHIPHRDGLRRSAPGHNWDAVADEPIFVWSLHRIKVEVLLCYVVGYMFIGNCMKETQIDEGSGASG